MLPSLPVLLPPCPFNTNLSSLFPFSLTFCLSVPLLFYPPQLPFNPFPSPPIFLQAEISPTFLKGYFRCWMLKGVATLKLLHEDDV